MSGILAAFRVQIVHALLFGQGRRSAPGAAHTLRLMHAVTVAPPSVGTNEHERRRGTGLLAR